VRVDGHATWASQRGACARRHHASHVRIRKAAASKGTSAASPRLLVDLAQDLIRSLIPPPAEDRFDEAVEAVIAECLAKGLTGAHEPGLDLAAVGVLYAAHRPRALSVPRVRRGERPEGWGQYREAGRPSRSVTDA